MWGEGVKKSPDNKQSSDAGNKTAGIPMGMATLALNKAKLAARPQAKDRNRKLLEMGVSGFVFAIAKRNRLQNPKTPRNRWFRWKDRYVLATRSIILCSSISQISFNS